MSSGRKADPQRSLVVELVGPAGAGKTTLLRALRRRDPRIEMVVRPGKFRQAEQVLGTGPMLLRTLLDPARSDRWFAREELRAIVYLGGWCQVLRPAGGRPDRVNVFDHGPVFRLATLREFGPSAIRSPGFERWWDQMLECWRIALDRIVWLDAPDATLLARIRSRDRDHAVKHRSDEEAHEFLRRYRTGLLGVLERLSTGSAPQTLRFDTSGHSTDEIAGELLASLGSGTSLATALPGRPRVSP